jgi:hypothetical protein
MITRVAEQITASVWESASSVADLANTASIASCDRER